MDENDISAPVAPPEVGFLAVRMPKLHLPSLPEPVKLWSKRLALGGAFSAYLSAMTVTGWVVSATSGLPSLDMLTERSRPVSIRVEDRYGRDLLVRGADEAGEIDAGELPDHFRDAVLAVEDRRFTHHIGIDVEGIARAAVSNLRSGRRGQGGSTLTQQLVKNVFLTRDKTYRRKVQEALLAVWMERLYTKDEILEMYLERVYFGSGTWGLEAAARQFFDAHPSELTLGQGAMLAGVLKAPSGYNPVAHSEAAGERATLVLDVMLRDGLITVDQHRTALDKGLSIRPPSAERGSNHFVDWIRSDLDALLGTLTDDVIVRTTLDRDIQAAAELAVATHLDAARGASEAAVVTLDASGGVLAMVGGRAYGDSQFNRATQAVRQPGSAFKPFVYLAAMEAGLSPWDLRVDQPVEIDGWQPRNFAKDYLGPVTIEEAFGRSLNTVAVSLSEEVGRERVVATAARFGHEVQPLRSVALGAQGATPLAMAESYLPFATWGERYTPFGILSVATTDGRTLYQAASPAPQTVIARRELGHMNRLMTRTVEAGTGRRARVSGHHIAGKTGTTNAFRDAWFVGVAPGFATSVWVGNDENSSMARVTGGSIPAAIFADTMGAVLADVPPSRLMVSQPPVWTAKSGRSLDTLLADIEGVLP